MSNLFTGAVAVCAAISLAGASQGSVVFSGTSGSLAASATFEVSGSGQLVVTLDNISTADVTVPAEVLTAVFFDITGPAMSFTRDSGVLAPGSSVFYDADGQPAGGVIGGEWAYKSGALNIGGPGSRAYGISSTGINIFGPGDLFPGPDLEPPSSPDGPQYGLLSAGDNTATGNGGITGSGGMIKHAAVFSLGGAGANFDLSRIGNVYFFYGTALGEGGFGGSVPTPGAVSLLGLAGVASVRRRR